jgi:RNA polymerase subunit RPABC4/transcription elongation factor Spt4
LSDTDKVKEKSMSDVREKKEHEMFCFSCGAVILKEAEICPKCGVRQKGQRNPGGSPTVYCISCGEVIKREAEICPKCGVRQRGQGSSGGLPDVLGGFSVASLSNYTKGFSIAGLVLGIVSAVGGFIPGLNYIAWLIGIVGIVLCVIARNNAKKANQPTGQATAGLVLSIIGTALALIGLLVCVACVGAATSALSDWNY